MYFVKKGCRAIFHRDGRIELDEDMQVVHDDGTVDTIPRGFICDGSSIPRIAWRVCGGPRHGTNLRPGVWHDHAYKFATRPRKECDLIYYRLLRNEGKSWLIAKLMYRAVRIFGGRFYGTSRIRQSVI